MTFDFPPDLLQLRKTFDALNRRCQDLAAALPSGATIIADGLSDPDPQVQALADEERIAYEKARAEYERDRAAYEAACAERMDIVLALHRHSWWTQDGPQAGNRAAAWSALQAAARGAG